MTAIAFPNWQTDNNDGSFAVGGKIYFWVPGTSTPRTPYSDTALTIPTTNPVLLNAAGWPATSIYLDSTLDYEYEVKSSNDAYTFVARKLISAAATGGGSGVEEAPNDGSYYARRSEGWTAFTPSGGGGGNAQTVATYAALTAIVEVDRTDGMVVYVVGRTSEDDGASGYWYFDAASSATADAGTILAPDAGTGRWIRQLVGAVYNVRWFGAKGDGSTNDTTAVQAAIAAIPTAGNYPGGVVYFPRGQYLIASTLSIPSYTTLQGDSRTTTKLTFTAQTSGVGITGSASQTFFPAVRKMQIENTFSHGIYANYWTNFHIEEVYVFNAGGDGILIDGGAYMGTFTNAWARDCTGRGFNFDGYCTSMHARNCFASECTSDGWRINEITYSSFTACGADTSTGGYGYRVSNVRNVTFTACGAERNEKSAFRLETSTSIVSGAIYPDVRECIIDNCFSWENGQDTTSPGFLEVSALNSRQIDVTVLTPFDDGPISTVSITANGETRITRHGGTLEGTISLSGNATCWNKDTRDVPAFGEQYLSGNYDRYINSVLVQRQSTAATTFRGSTVGSAFTNFLGTTNSAGAVGIAIKNSDTNTDSRDWGFYTGNETRGDFVIMRSSAAQGNPISGTTAVRFDATGARVTGAIAITDGVTAPSTLSGYGWIYIDSADGDLKIKFGDGTVKTIITDT